MTYTTKEYINSLKRDKEELINVLKNKKIDISEKETFTSLIPKINNIGVEITDYSYYFYQKARLSQINEIMKSIKKITNVKYMFSNIASEYADRNGVVLDLDFSNIDTSELTSLELMFSSNSYLNNLTIKNLDVSNVTTLRYCFSSLCVSHAIGVDKLDFDFSNSISLTNLEGTFKQAKIETLVPKINTSKVTTLNETFGYCSSMTTLDIGSWDLGNVNNVNWAFQSCTNLTNLIFGINYGKKFGTTTAANTIQYTLNLSASTLLTHNSLMDVINKLYDIGAKGCKTQKLNIGAENMAKLTEEEIAIATNKGWTVA